LTYKDSTRLLDSCRPTWLSCWSVPTKCLPGILAYHYHAHHPAAWTKISEYISNGPLVLRAHSWPTVTSCQSSSIRN